MRKQDSKLMGFGVSIGPGIGTALGVAMNNIGAGIAVGVPIGIAPCFAFNRKKSNKPEE